MGNSSIPLLTLEWLSGDGPFHGSLTQIVKQHISTPPPSLREQGLGALPGVEQVVMRALAKERKECFASVQEFAQALVTVLQQPYCPHK